MYKKWQILLPWHRMILELTFHLLINDHWLFFFSSTHLFLATTPLMMPFTSQVFTMFFPWRKNKSFLILSIFSLVCDCLNFCSNCIHIWLFKEYLFTCYFLLFGECLCHTVPSTIHASWKSLYIFICTYSLLSRDSWGENYCVYDPRAAGSLLGYIYPF